jgi:hypothetical protein
LFSLYPLYVFLVLWTQHDAPSSRRTPLLATRITDRVRSLTAEACHVA